LVGLRVWRLVYLQANSVDQLLAANLPVVGFAMAALVAGIQQTIP
jgi:hypothetical protein